MITKAKSNIVILGLRVSVVMVALALTSTSATANDSLATPPIIVPSLVVPKGHGPLLMAGNRLPRPRGASVRSLMAQLAGHFPKDVAGSADSLAQENSFTDSTSDMLDSDVDMTMLRASPTSLLDSLRSWSAVLRWTRPGDASQLLRRACDLYDYYQEPDSTLSTLSVIFTQQHALASVTGEALVLCRAAQTLAEYGCPDQADSLITLLRSQRGAAGSLFEAELSRTLAWSCWIRHDSSKAISHWKDALARAESFHDNVLISGLCAELADAECARGAFVKSAAHSRQILLLPNEYCDPLSSARAYANLMRVDLRAGRQLDLAHAAACYDSACAGLLGLYQCTSTDSYRNALSDIQRDLTDELVAALMPATTLPVGGPRVSRALWSVDAFRGLSLNMQAHSSINSWFLPSGPSEFWAPYQQHLLYYYVGPQWLFTWHLDGTAHSVTGYRVELSSDSLASLVSAWRRQLGVALSSDLSLTHTPSSGAQGSAGIQLSRLLVPKALRDSLPDGSSVVICPQGVLWLVPFSALPVGERKEKNRYFGDVHPLRLWLSGQLSSPLDRNWTPLPDVERESGKFKAWCRRGVVIGPAAGPRGITTELSGARAEADTVASRLGTSVLEGTGQALQSFYRQLGRATLLHVACHAKAYSSRDSTMLSYLDLSGVGDPRARVTARDLIERAPPTDNALLLVVLSACETANGYVARDEGAFGLQRAFLLRDVPCVMSTQWLVNDSAAQELMTRFYSYWLSHHYSTWDEALWRAEASLRSNPTFAAPRYWAAFQFVSRD